MGRITAALFNDARKVTSFFEGNESLIASNYVACDPALLNTRPSAWEVDAGDNIVPNADENVTEGMVRDEGARRLRILGSGYEPEERETWATQVEEALSYPGDPTPPMLTMLAQARSMTVADMVTRVLTLRDMNRNAAAAILAAQETLINTTPIPADYDDDTHWP